MCMCFCLLGDGHGLIVGWRDDDDNREPGHEALYDEVWDAAMAYSKDIAAGRVTKPTR